MSESDQPSLVCLRCGRALIAGQSDFYVVKIESFADPTPRSVSAEELQTRNFAAEMQQLIGSMHDKSERELVDDVYRRTTLHLCGRCYRAWIENPVGDANE